MYLSKLEILGFKSFADKINLNFKDGLSAIVGPNGSGKTNFVDALRWVLGEQKTSVLRSESMDNVIFNGSKNRRPLGLSEVSITIKNTKKILPSEYDEINISRRLYRDGESQYLINKVPARLKDITGLFMDTGLGSDSYSVIELKMVENLLNGNPADRRDVFEEAAGIKKYKLNKKETTKRLQNVELDLERLNDIFQEVQKNVNSLARQAAKTRRYNTLIAELKDLEIRLFAFELFSYRSKLISKQADEAVALGKIDEINKEISEIERFLNELKKDFNSVDDEFQILVRNELNINNNLSSINSEISLNEEKIKSLEINQTTIKFEIEESNKYLSESKGNLERLNSEITELKTKAEGFDADFEMVKSEGKLIQSNFQQKEKEVSQFNSNISDLKNKLSYHNSLINRNAQSNEKTKQKILEEEQKLKSYDQQLVELQKQFLEKSDNLNVLKTKVQDSKRKYDELLVQKTSSEKKMEQLRNEEFDAKNQLQKLQNEKNFLENIVVSNESTKYLLKNDKWFTGDKVLLGEVITIDEKYKLALNSALDFAVSSFLVEDFDNIEKGIVELKTSKQGVASFILNNVENSKVEKTIKLSEQSGFLGYLSDFITVNSEYQSLIERLTGNILVVENFDSAKKILISLQNNDNKFSDIKIISLTGELFSSNGLITGGGEAANQKTQLIGRRNRIKKLDAEISEFKTKIETFQKEFKTEQEKISGLKLSENENNLKIYERDLTNLEKEVSQIELRIDSFKNNYKIIEENIDKLMKEAEELSNEDISFGGIIENVTSELTKNQEIIITAKEALEEVRKELENWNQKSKQAEIELVRIQGDLKYKETEIQKIESSIQTTKQRISDKEKEFETNVINKQNISQKISEGLNNKQILIDSLQEAIAKKEQSSQNRKMLQERISNYESTLENLRKNFAKFNDEFHSIGLEIASLNSKIESLFELTFEQYKVNLDEYFEKNPFTEEETKSFDLITSKTDIALLKEKISVLGNVNFQALEDYEEQKTRLDFLLTQLTDLKNSQKLLLETIEEINKIAVEKFTVTFNEIRTNFQNLFKVLFGSEGEADLTLEGDSPLDASVLISAKPPFKKPNSIDLLSAGEKTLTAIALLFSIYLVKPSPFCVLDEVDAPLDDSNIDKYIALIRKFSFERGIQFILITHNKKTMEAADTLYGLTMEEEGVTKVVSVKLEK